MGRRGRDSENGLLGEVRHELGPEGKQTGTCQDKSKLFDARDSTVLGQWGERKFSGWPPQNGPCKGKKQTSFQIRIELRH